MSAPIVPEMPAPYPMLKPSRTRQNSSARILRWGRNTFLLFGILVLGYCGYVPLDTKLYQAGEAQRFQQELSSIQATASERPVTAISGKTLGRIEIPRIGLAAMILEGIDGRTLRRAVGHLPSTPLPGQRGNVAIAGHRDTFFRGLRNVKQGDEIRITTLGGSYRYLVDSTKIVPPEDMRVLVDSGDAILTLVTCYPFYFVGSAPQRFIVRAHQLPA